MNCQWDLSYLYKSFEDKEFLADLARLPEMIRAQQDILKDATLTDVARLEKLADSMRHFLPSATRWVALFT